MRNLIVGFSKNKKGAWGSRLIMWFLRKPFSHTYFKFKEIEFQDYTIFEATGRGLNYISETRFLEHNTPVREFEIVVSDELFLELMIDCHDHAGIEYGFAQNAGIAIVRILRKLNFQIDRNPLNKGINCSEWLYYILEDIYGAWTKTEPNLVAPDEVFDFLEEMGKWEPPILEAPEG